MLRIGLTGGIASGKSRVSGLFEALGVPVIDTDLIARELVKPGSRQLKTIEETFGSRVLCDNGSLDRAAMRDIVFASDEKRSQLEDILHPAIRDRVTARLASLHEAAYAIIVIPLLVESRYPIEVDRVLVVDAPESKQLERVMSRDSIDRERAESILRAQTDRKRRLAVADDILLNDSDLESLHRKVQELHRFYLGLARQETADRH